ncbi:MAG: hypothetical protein CR971_00510 [candidate division SR1 bacterium]|nr:MAG: hypothetical protein CR971_00510 [candidate division SR1 bacterium]
MEAIQKQNPYDLIDGKAPVENPANTEQKHQQEKKESANANKPGKFINGLMSMLARMMGKPDPLTGKMYTPKNTENDTTVSGQQPKDTAKEVLAGVEKFLGKVGNQLEATATTLENKANTALKNISTPQNTSTPPVNTPEHTPEHTQVNTQENTQENTPVNTQADIQSNVQDPQVPPQTAQQDTSTKA